MPRSCRRSSRAPPSGRACSRPRPPRSSVFEPESRSPAGAADTTAALGSGLVEPRTVQLTIGTGAQLVKPVTALREPLPDSPATHLYRATDTGWYAMGAVLNGGLTLNWVRRLLGASW